MTTPQGAGTTPLPQVCYQIHSHRSPAQLYRLVSVLAAANDALIVVSHARQGAAVDTARLRRCGASLVMETDGGYGDWSHIRRYLEVAERLAVLGIDYDWMVSLSGQDYPVRPLADIRAELARSTADGFVEHFPVLSADSPWGLRRGRTRYDYHHRRLFPLRPGAQRALRPAQVVNRLQPALSLHVAYGLTVGWRVRSPFGADLTCYGGSFFSSLTRPSVERVRRFARDRPDVVEHYQQTLSPAESFLQTALLSDADVRLVNDCKVYFDFRGSRLNHPRTLDVSDISPARQSGAHFARKWDLDRDPDAFDLLDDHVLALVDNEARTPRRRVHPES